MNREIQTFKEAVARIVILLRADHDLTAGEQEVIASEVGRVRSELGLWRSRRPSN